jgi:hypothetical protein
VTELEKAMEELEAYRIGFIDGVRNNRPPAPPGRTMRDTFFRGLRETEESRRRCVLHDWCARGWNDGRDFREGLAKAA